MNHIPIQIHRINIKNTETHVVNIQNHETNATKNNEKR